MADHPAPNRRRIAAAIIFAAPLVAVPLCVAAMQRPAPRQAVSHRPASVPTQHPELRSIPATKPMPVADKTLAPTTALVVKRILDTGGPIRYGSYFWNENDVPAGPLVITVDLAAETISAFRGGYEIGTAAVIYGDKGRDTPLGVFPITQKDAHHVSNLYGAPMPYMLRLTNDGISIHGSKVEWDYATHGCIGVPIGFAKKLFAAASLGDRVIVTRGKMLTLGQPVS